jgi:bifunctional DNA-binding transcriptional regulator/antitoxin component of YhaV-PrlF toxin-antitoxin module
MKMETEVVVTRKGQTTIPARLRKNIILKREHASRFLKHLKVYSSNPKNPP